ncbi:hypothetical protein FJNA_23890 [Thermus sp. FJN-A]
MVAPVGVGYQEDLVAWAEASGYQVGSQLEHLRPPALWLPPSRSHLFKRLGELEGVWFSEAELVWEAGEWEDALAAYPGDFRRATYEETEGWPLGLALAREVGTWPLASHPQVVVRLKALVPVEVEAAAFKAARAPVLAPILWAHLGLSPEEVYGLWDRGLLVPKAGGVALPRLLTRVLCPFWDPEEVRYLAKRLLEVGLGEAAILSYLEVGLVVEALEAALVMDLQEENRLRGILARVPEAWCDHPLYNLLAGRLARKGSQAQVALAFLEKAGSDPGLEPWRQLELGLLHVAQGEVAKAEANWSEAYRLASQPVLRAKAAHNLAGLWVVRGEYRAVEPYLKEAVGLFRALAKGELEGESLLLLALSYQAMGRLREAEVLYKEALGLFSRYGRPTGLLWGNLAELYLLRGELHKAHQALEKAEEDPRARGVALLNRAWLYLLLGESEALEEVLQQPDTQETRLDLERRLLLARVARHRGEREKALGLLQGLEDLRADLERVLLGALEPELLRERAMAKGAQFEACAALLLLGRVEELLPILKAEKYGLFTLDPGFGVHMQRLSENHPELRDFLPVRIRGLGPFRVYFAGKRFILSEFSTRKAAALLVLLALQPGGWPRVHLAERLWSDSANPEGSLATALYFLNRLFQARLSETHKGVVRLVYPVELDLTQIEEFSDVRQLSRPILPELADLLPDEAMLFEARRERRLTQLKKEDTGRVLAYLEDLVLHDPLNLEARRELVEFYRRLGYERSASLQEERLNRLLS